MRANSHRSSQNSLEMHFQVDLKSLFLLLQSALNLIVAARLQSMHFKKPAQRPDSWSFDHSNYIRSPI